MFFFDFKKCLLLIVWLIGTNLYTRAQNNQFSDKEWPQETNNIAASLIRYRSFSGKEKAAMEYLKQKALDMQLQVQQWDASIDNVNLAVSVFPLNQKKPNIILLSHIDVVNATDSIEWRKPPFSGLVEEDTLWGRGALDMKGIAAMQLMAVKLMADDFKKNYKDWNLTVLFVGDEEAGGKNGGDFITKNYLDSLNPLIVLGEGGGGFSEILPSKPGKQVFFVSQSEKRSLWIKLSINHKVRAHSSVPSSETANKILMRAVSRIEDEPPIIIFDKTTKKMFQDLGKLNGGIKGWVLSHINSYPIRPFRRSILQRNPFLLSLVTNTYQFTRFENSELPPNVIPNKASVYYDCRLLPGVKTDRFIRRLKIKIRNPKIKISIEDQSPENPTTQNPLLFKALQTALQEQYKECSVIPVLFPATTDNSFFRAYGIPAYGILPILLNNEMVDSVHGINEYIPLKNLHQGVEAYCTIIKKILHQVSTHEIGSGVKTN